MKRLNLETNSTEEILNALEHVVETHTKYSKSYFWTNRGNAASRRWRENKFYEENEDILLEDRDNVIKIEFSYEESCKNVYYKCNITINDSKSSIKLVKDIIKSIKKGE